MKLKRDNGRRPSARSGTLRQAVGRNDIRWAGWMVWAMLMASSVEGRAQTLSIESFDGSGQLTFQAVPGATSYRVEWAPTPEGPWSTFEAAADELNAIAGPGSGIMTCSVPMVYRVVADLAPPEGMALIPDGEFQMGDTFGEGWATAEAPVHTVQVSTFYLDQHEVTLALWDEVSTWADANGYSFASGSGKAMSHPVVNVNWYDCVKWCNARSEKEGLTAVYYTSPSRTGLYRTGTVDVSSESVDWGANGYRLPTNAEWGKAARGGLVGQRFPWGASINHDQANYIANGSSYPYDTSPYTTDTYHLSYAIGNRPYTSPVGSFPPNGFGLYDMSGNVREWCWDWYQDHWYADAGATQNDTPGPRTSPVNRRVLRNVDWNGYGGGARCAYYSSVGAWNESDGIGFRCARRP